VTVEFDLTNLEFQSVESADFAGPTVNIDNQNGVVTFTQSQSGGIGKPSVAQINYEVLADAQTDVTVTSEESTLFDGNGNLISEVTYEREVPGSGDVNGDGQINADGTVPLQQYTVGETSVSIQRPLTSTVTANFYRTTYRTSCNRSPTATAPRSTSDANRFPER
jgi:FlaG/FlaF family flagellin (archaellin)